jgi:Ca2+-binding RTX toxin-like protein
MPFTAQWYNFGSPVAAVLVVGEPGNYRMTIENNGFINGSIPVGHGTTVIGPFTPAEDGLYRVVMSNRPTDGEVVVMWLHHFLNQSVDTEIFGTGRQDLILLGAFNDTGYGFDGDDMMFGNAGDDQLIGGTGRDTLFGGTDADLLLGGDDSDVLYGEDGDDRLLGGDLHDTLFGGEGNDKLFGGDGSDSLFSGLGDDVLIGGGDADTFWFLNMLFSAQNEMNSGSRDRILDFNAAEGDILAFGGVGAARFLDEGAFTGNGGAEFNIRYNARGDVVVGWDLNQDRRPDGFIVLVGVTTISEEAFLFGI